VGGGGVRTCILSICKERAKCLSLVKNSNFFMFTWDSNKLPWRNFSKKTSLELCVWGVFRFPKQQISSKSYLLSKKEAFCVYSVQFRSIKANGHTHCTDYMLKVSLHILSMGMECFCVCSVQVLRLSVYTENLYRDSSLHPNRPIEDLLGPGHYFKQN